MKILNLIITICLLLAHIGCEPNREPMTLKSGHVIYLSKNEQKQLEIYLERPTTAKQNAYPVWNFIGLVRMIDRADMDVKDFICEYYYKYSQNSTDGEFEYKIIDYATAKEKLLLYNSSSKNSQENTGKLSENKASELAKTFSGFIALQSENELRWSRNMVSGFDGNLFNQDERKAKKLAEFWDIICNSDGYGNSKTYSDFLRTRRDKILALEPNSRKFSFKSSGS